MGKIAQPNTPYCGGFTQGAISAGGQIFTTQNPPISYTLSGKTATISDATGVIGEADLTGNLIEASRAKANPGVEYCGVPYAEMKVGNITFGTENPPISYTLKTKALRVNGQLLNLSKEIQSWTTQQQLPEIRVDWGNGDIDTLSGDTWTEDNQGASTGWAVFARGTTFAVSTNTYWGSYVSWVGEYGQPYRTVSSGSGWVGSSVLMCGALPPYPMNSKPPGNPPTFPVVNGGFSVTGSGGRTVCDIATWRFTTWTNPAKGGSTNQSLGLTGGYLPGSIFWRRVAATATAPTWTVTSNTGGTSQRTQYAGPDVTLEGSGDPSCLLTITYTDGTTQFFTYTECPTVEPVQCAEVSDGNGVMGESCPFNGEATAVCYDYDITEVKYACEGQCPSAEFECRCEASNTLMCYGWDPNNPDIFKPLFVTSITSG